MPFPISIKEEYVNEVIGFNNSGAPLGQRNDLHILAALARTSNPSLAKYFDQLPTLEQLEEDHAEDFLNENPAPAEDGGGKFLRIGAGE